MGNTSSSHLKFKMLSGILIFNQKGENLIFRAFRNDCRPRLADVFRIQVISNAHVRSPILTLGSTTFSHVKHENIYLVAITKAEYSIAIRANYGSKLFATNVVVRVPTPLNTAKITERCTQGKAKYEPSENNIVWKIPRFTGQNEFVLSAEATLTSMTNQKAWSRPPLSLNFSLLMFTSSGLLVRYLKVFEKSNYSSVKWVRYMTRSGSYEIRF